MTRLEANNNAIAAFFYALSYYPGEIISLTSNGITYCLSIQWPAGKYEMKTVQNALQDIILSTGKVMTYQPYGTNYEILTITWLYF